MEEAVDSQKALSSKKRALLIGINYVGQGAQLSGCVNDIVDMRAVCAALGYEEVCVLYDGHWAGAFDPRDNRLGDTRPTRANMTAAFRWLTAGAASGDKLLLHYSGHGGQLRALKPGTEVTGMDDTVVPVDYETAGMMRDDELYTLLVAPLRGTGAVLRGILDCCHSGTGLDLRYNLSLSRLSSIFGDRSVGGASGPASDLASEVRETVDHLVEDSVRSALVRWFGAEAVAERLGKPDVPEFIEWTADGAETALTASAVESRALSAVAAAAPDAILVSGCADMQTSADARFGSRANGALTYYILEIIRPVIASRAWPAATDFLRDLRRRLRAGGYDQLPQVSSEAPVNRSTKFNLV
jgi:hypothetical protein